MEDKSAPRPPLHEEIKTGRVALVYLRRDRGRVEYTYIYKGAEYQTGVAIHRTKGTQALTAGDPVILLVDASKPKRAFIRDLYK